MGNVELGHETSQPCSQGDSSSRGREEKRPWERGWYLACQAFYRGFIFYIYRDTLSTTFRHIINATYNTRSSNTIRTSSANRLLTLCRQ